MAKNSIRTGLMYLGPYQIEKHLKENEAIDQKKRSSLTKLAKKDAHKYLSPQLLHDRWRLDLMWDGQNLGIKSKSDESGEFEFFEINEIDSAAPEIIECMKWFKQSFPLKTKAQIRFRKGRGKFQGIWIDASREDLDKLKNTHAKWVKEALEKSYRLEVGQRKEEWVLNEDGEVKSQKTRLTSWLPSFTFSGTQIPLLSTQSSFSQPGPAANQCLIDAGHELLNQIDLDTIKSWAEWGAGNGNLSASMSIRLGADDAWISEPDPNSFRALKENHAMFFPKATISREPASKVEKSFDLWILDPPRSGFSELINTITDDSAPNFVLSYHCATKGWEADSTALIEKGYSLQQWIYCDIFPGSDHAEMVSMWTRNI